MIGNAVKKYVGSHLLDEKNFVKINVKKPIPLSYGQRVQIMCYTLNKLTD